MGQTIQTAMIIDDDVDMALLLENILKNRKIHVLSVDNLKEAEDCLTYMKPTVIFLDNSFPEGLGVNFIQNIKEADDEIKIIMITADPDSWVKEKALKEGVAYFVKKPFTRPAIDTILDKLNFRKAEA